MKSISSIIIALTIGLNSFSQIQSTISSSRTSGVAPLAVFFDAGGTTAQGVAFPFHELNYVWNFGDASSGNWAYGNSLYTSKNEATGSVASHVFEAPGSYIVTLNVSDLTGNNQTQQVTIIVDDPNSTFSDTNTICFSNTNDFTGAPPGALQITTNSIDDINTHIDSGKRLLLKRGNTFTSTEGVVVSETGPSILGAFGDCISPNAQGICSNNPIINVTSTAGQIATGLASASNLPATDWRIMDIEFAGIANTTGRGVSFSENNQNVLLLRLNIHDFRGAVFIDESQNLANNNMFVVDSELKHGHGGLGANLIWFSSGSHTVIMGNKVHDAVDIEHVIRIPFIDGGVISHNDLSDQRPKKAVIKMHSENWANFNRYSQNVVISDNIMTPSNIDDTSRILTIKPGNCAIPGDQRLRDIIVERNHFKFVSFTQNAITISARNITVRNNIFNMKEGQFQNGINIDLCNDEPSPKDIWIYNNTFYSEVTSNPKGIDISNGTDISVINNLMSAPNSSNPIMILGTASIDNANLLTDNPGFLTASPNNDLDFQLNNASVAIDAGSSIPVFNDFTALTNSRPLNTNFDIGAFEFGSSTLGLDSTISESVNIKLYPNPSNGNFNIKNIPLNSKIQIVDVNGKVLYNGINENLSEVTIDISSFHSGIYFISINNLKQNTIVKKVFKIN